MIAHNFTAGEAGNWRPLGWIRYTGLAENPLGEFLSSHAVLSSIFFVFITLATPVIAATATHFGSHSLQQWWELRKARKQFARSVKCNVFWSKYHFLPRRLRAFFVIPHFSIGQDVHGKAEEDGKSPGQQDPL